MSKVQEAIVKLRTKVSRSATLADNLRIPAQQEHQSSQLPNDPASLKTWLIAQGVINSAGMAKSLLRSLQHSNRTINTPALRMQMMALYEKPFLHAMQSLDTHYLYLDFPLHADAEKSFQLAGTLCQEMAYGYKIALADQLALKKARPGKTSRQYAISQALEHLAQLALRHSQTYHSWPTDLWRDINTLVRVSMNDGTTDRAIDGDKQNGKRTLTIKEQFARLCALSIIDQGRFPAEQLNALFKQLTMRAASVEFYPSPRAPFDKLYSVGEDSAPVLHEFRQPRRAEKLMYFSLALLLSSIESTDERSLKLRSQSVAKRRESRANRAGYLTAETGLKEIHTLIRLAPPVEATETQFTDVAELLADDNCRLPNAFNTGNSLDEIASPNVLNSINTTDFGTRFEVENESINGFGLRTSGGTLCRLQIGELMAHCYRGANQETSWHLAVVRWLSCQTDGVLRFGVESISRHANAVDVIRLVKGRQRAETPSEALLINYQPIDSKAKMLVLPLHKYMAGETVGYRDDTGFHLVKLIERVDMDGNFQCFAISTMDDEVGSTMAREPAKFHSAA